MLFMLLQAFLAEAMLIMATVIHLGKSGLPSKVFEALLCVTCDFTATFVLIKLFGYCSFCFVILFFHCGIWQFQYLQ